MFKIFHYILQFFFPTQCISCGVLEERICKTCCKKIQTNEVQVCPVSLQKSSQGKRLEDYESQCNLDALLVYAQYEDNKILQELITRFKYFWSFDIAYPLGDFLKNLLQKEKINIQEFTLVPVPLYWKRFLERGFNQSSLLAAQIGKNKRLLKRIKNTHQQAKLSASERKKNVQGSFSYIGNHVPKKVILVDDVASTGATLNECARVLKAAGVKEVFAVVLARNI